MTRRVKRPAGKRADARLAVGDRLEFDVGQATVVVRFAGAHRDDDGLVRGRVVVESARLFSRVRVEIGVAHSRITLSERGAVERQPLDEIPNNQGQREFRYAGSLGEE